MIRKNKYLMLLGFLILSPIFLMGLGFYCFSTKKGFSLDKISSKLPHNEMWETKPLSPEEKDDVIKNVLSQTFHYLGSGSHSYAFVSQDGKYVLKFFKMHKILPKKLLMDFPFSLFEKYRLDNVEKKQLVFENIFKSFKDAYEHLRECSGLIYLHLNKTRDLKTNITVITYEGKKILVDLDSKPFAIQLKAQRICDWLLYLRDQNNEEEIHLTIRSFFDLIVQRCKQGFGDQRNGIRNNFGFVNGRAIIVNCGHMFIDDSLKFPHNFQAEILSAAEKMSQWAEQMYPDLIVILQEEAQFIIDKYLREN